MSVLGFRPLALARGLLRRIGVAPERKTPFSSFQGYLPQLVRWAAPEQVLEFGPGLSTRLILSNSTARVVSFETHPMYFERARQTLPRARLELQFVPNGPDFSTLSAREFDFVFVDGGDRVENLKQAHELLAGDGIVVLHDAHREDYEPGVLCYARGYFIENHSLVLCKNPSRLEEIEARFPPDESCACHYCGTRERIEYRQRVGSKLRGAPARPSGEAPA